MMDLLRSRLPANAAADEESARLGRLVHILALGMIASGIIPLLHNTWVHRWDSVAALSFGETCAVAVVWLNWIGQLKAAVRLLLVSLLTTVTALLIASHEGFRNVAILLFPSILLAAGLLQTRRSFIGFALASIACVCGVVLAEIVGWIVTPYSGWTSLRNVADIAVILTLTAVFVSLLTYNLRRSLDQARQHGAALQEAEERYKALFDRSMDCLYINDFEGRFLDANPAALALFGYKREEISSLSYASMMSPDQLSKAMQVMEEIKVTGIQQGTTEFRLRHKNGQFVEVETHSSLVFRDGKPYAVQGIARDITARKRADEALRQSEEMFAKVFKSSPAPMVISEIETGRYIDVNDQYLKMLGYTRDEILTRSSKDLGIWAEPGVRDRMITRLKGENSFREIPANFYTKSREMRMTLWSAEKITLDGRDRMLSLYYDYTERCRMEKELLRTQGLLEAALSQSPSGILIADAPSVSIRFANAAALEIRGPTSQPLTGLEMKEQARRWQSFMIDGITPYPPEKLPLSRAILEGVTSKNVQIIIRRDDGEKRWISANASPVKDDKGQILAGVVVFQDITEGMRAELEQKNLQAQLIHAQKMEAVGQLAGGIAHDFNNILTAILLQLNLLQMEHQIAPEVQEGLKDLETEAQRAISLTRQLLIFSRREVIRPQVFDLSSLLGNLLKMLRRLIGEHINLELSGPSEDLWLEADPGMMEQVVMNLVVNARDAMPNGGRLTLHTRLVEYDETVCAHNSEARAGRFVCMTVSDAGCGMDEATKERIFDPFFTTKAAGKGTGLGLATVYGIVKQHQGWVEVESTVGKGSSFSVFLPAHNQVPKPSEVSIPNEPMPHGSETLLLVEDDKSVRALASRTLQQLGYRVLEAGNAKEALKTWGLNDGEVDLLITDMVMPGGTTGLELAEQLFKQKPAFKAILVSGYCVETEHWNVPNMERIHFMHKPINPVRLAKVVRELLDSV